MKKALIIAGGTGGHIFPGLTIAKELQKQGFTLHWLGSKQGLEVTILPKYDIPCSFINITGLRGKGLLAWLLAPIKVSVALVHALCLIKKINPQLVFCMGGFVAGPGGIAAKLLRRKLIIHEQNAIAGTTNKVLAYIADLVCSSFPNSFNKKVNTVVTGNPVREELASITKPALILSNQPLRILVLGGSRGALALNNCVPHTINMWNKTRPIVWHQTGAKHLLQIQNLYKELAITAQVSAFIDDMTKAYAWADLVICRAGATTIFELIAVGVASILIPFPFAIDDHQTHNALYLANHNAGILLPQSKLQADTLYKLVDPLICDRQKLRGMAVSAKALFNQQTAKEIVARSLAI